MWIFAGFVAHGARKLDDFVELFQGDADHPYILDQLKQLGFYTDCLGKSHWSEPSEVISKTIAEGLVQNADIVAAKRNVTVRELELWVEHLGPVWNGPKEHMEDALVRWNEAMVRENLLDESNMEQFITRGMTFERDKETGTSNN